MKRASQPTPDNAPVRSPWLEILLAMASAGGVCWYLFGATGWDLAEVGRFLAGVAALWLPFGWLTFLLVRDQFDDALSRFTFSAIASYALTTLVYFGCSVGGLWLPGCEALFHVVQIVALVASLFWGFRRGLIAKVLRLPAAARRIDWLLVALVVASSLVTVRYKSAFEYQPRGDRFQLVTDGDQTYYTAACYEFGRHTPALQQATRAGVPERAYHMFPHLTTMLLARYTCQPDMLRAHLVYEYTVIEVLVSLALFCLARSLTTARWPGYASVILMYIAALPLPHLYGETSFLTCFFYFTAWPHASSTLEPVLITSPQTYPGILATYGIFLGIANLSSRVSHGGPIGALALLTAALVGAMARLRIQIFLPLFPGFLILMAVFTLKTRRFAFVTAACLAVVVAVVLVLEMRLPIYLPQTSTLALGNARLGEAGLLNTWPGSVWVRGMLAAVFAKDSTAFDWIWSVVAIVSFSLINVMGIPQLIVSAYGAMEGWARLENGPVLCMIVWLVAGSMIGACCIRASYDPWSVGGQMLLHVGWYSFPLLGPGLWAIGRRLPAAWRKPVGSWVAMASMLLALAFAWQIARPASALERKEREKQILVGADDWAALAYIRARLPSDAVILSPNLHGLNTAFFSGVGGRRAYLEYAPSSLSPLMDGEATDEYRDRRIREIWTAQSAEEFERLLPQGVTHLVEYVGKPLTTRAKNCLKRTWSSPSRQVAIWEVVR